MTEIYIEDKWSHKQLNNHIISMANELNIKILRTHTSNNLANILVVYFQSKEDAVMFKMMYNE